MSKVDITLAIIIMAGAYQGVKDGFVLEIISILALLLGVLAGFKIMDVIMVNLEEKYHIDTKVLPYISFSTVFFVIVFFVNLASRYISPKVNHHLLGPLDSAVGAVFGLFRSAFMLSILLWIYFSMNLYLPADWTKDSWLFPLVREFGPDVTHGIARVLPFFEGVF